MTAPLFSRLKPFGAALVEGIMRIDSVKYFEFRPVVQKEIRLKGISYLDIWQPFCSAECNHLCNFGRGYYEEQFSEIILNWSERFRSRYCLKDFLSGGLWWPSCSVEQNHLCNFEKRRHGEHSCEGM